MRNPWLWVASLAVLLATIAGVHFAPALAPQSPPGSAAHSADPTPEFLTRHWPDALLPQGEPPPGFSTLEASLDPASCGQCHASQYADWKSSLHSKAMGPGILWQFHLMRQGGANGCMRCHAPLAEQKALLAMERHWEHAPATPPPRYVPPDLHRQGLVCAACHVRQHARFGPPAPGRSPPGQGALPHGGFVASPAFGDSRFCAVCHQFAPQGARLNGKLIENTFAEWQESAAAKQGRSCQSCHMPGRRHLWRGIHDPDMARQALRASLDVRDLGRGMFEARAELANVGAGHHFPTYLVPEVVATLRLVDAGGAVRSELERRVIGRNADLDLTEELFDTRIASGARVLIGGRYRAPEAKGWSVELRVLVHPGKHYERLFRRELERRGGLAPEAAALLRQALAQLEGSSYELYRIRKQAASP